jgi:hypothetical protein
MWMGRTAIAGPVAWAALAALAAAAGEPQGMGKPVEYPHAGISLAAPAGFRYQELAKPFEVVRLVVTEEDRPVQAVTLSAFPVAAKAKPDEYADVKLMELKKNLAIRQLKLLKKTPISVGGVPGTARMMSYTFRGAKTIAAQVYFIRDVKGSKARICYLLTVVAPLERQAKLLPMLGALIKSVRLVSVRHPQVALPLALGAPVKDYELGFRIARPRGWYATSRTMGAEMGQVDYLLSGVPLPSIRLLITEATGEATTAQACAKQYLAMARAVAQRRQETCELVSESPAKLGEMPAYEFVLKHVPKRESARPGNPNKAGDPQITIQRTACGTREATEPPRVYLLILTWRGKDAKTATAVMAQIAASFSLLGPSSRPATQPATRPAATAPATRAAKP